MLSGDTIGARITAPGLGAVALVRVSGPRSKEVLSALTNSSEPFLKPRTATLVCVNDLISGQELDTALAIFFKGPNSYTGEDSFELSLHGSSYLVQRLIENLNKLGVRHARAGEFTERAYLNGKLDLTQAEAVSDLISAETEAQAKLARDHLQGRLSKIITDIGSPLRDLLAQIEAYIDFPEEGISPLHYGEWGKAIRDVILEIESITDSYSTGRLLRDGASVVLVGVPNAGKSSLLNALLGEARAIVSPISGTTRDTIEERVSIDGVLVRFCDTAGLADNTGDALEALGIERSWQRVKAADLALFLFDPTQAKEPQVEMFKRVSELGTKTVILLGKDDIESNQGALGWPKDAIRISSKTQSGLDELRAAIVRSLIGERRESVVISSARHRASLIRSAEFLRSAVVALESKTPPEFISIDIRAALTELEEIVGVTTSDDVLGLIFSKFCIGK